MDWLAMRWTVLRAGVSTPLEKGPEDDLFTDPDLEKWAAGDHMVINNAANPYGNRKPGYLTRSGYGSLEVGASQERIGSDD